MKSIYLYITMILFIVISHASATEGSAGIGKKSISGSIVDKATGEKLPGVIIYIPDLKKGTISKADGTYLIENLPSSQLLFHVSLIGYKTVIETINLADVNTRNFEMESSIKEMDEIVVAGLSTASELKRTPTPTTIVSKTDLLQASATNIVDALTTQPGINQVSTGTGISKPVIRGLGYNRIVIVNDGIRQEGQQWGDEHGLEIDEYSVDKVEILKGPASLSYGSDAIAGVINFVSAPTLPEGKIKGNIITNYQTNNGLKAISANVNGNLKGLIWDVRYSNKSAHAYKNRYDGYVFNSGFLENTISGVLGLNKSWGYSHLHFSAYEMMPGIVEGERDSLTGSFIKPIAFNDTTIVETIATDNDFMHTKLYAPYQKINHYKAVLNNNFVLGKGNLKAIVGFQQNQRKEYADVLKQSQYGLFFLLNTVNYDLRYVLPNKNDLNVSFGINGMQQNSKNKGVEFLIPDYDLFDIGGFILAHKRKNRLDISAGIRYDVRMLNVADLYVNSDGQKVDVSDTSAYRQFEYTNSTFSGLSGSFGFTFQISEDITTKFNLSKGYRAPNIAEFSANGVHEGTIRYEIGNKKLKPEHSFQADYSLGINSTHVTAQVDVFANSITNYIYLQKMNAYSNQDSIRDGYTVFGFVSGNALLYGGELLFDIHPHPLDWLHFENSFSFVEGIQLRQPDSMSYLPFMPAPKYQSQLKAEFKNGFGVLKNTYLKIELDYYLAQNKIHSAYSTETKTPHYYLLNAGIGTDVVVKDKMICSFYIIANNILDVGYQNHLSRLKYAPVNYSTGRSGVFNMGRNISFKLVIPFNIKK